jgi:hypothetical protein
LARFDSSMDTITSKRSKSSAHHQYPGITSQPGPERLVAHPMPAAGPVQSARGPQVNLLQPSKLTETTLQALICRRSHERAPPSPAAGGRPDGSVRSGSVPPCAAAAASFALDSVGTAGTMAYPPGANSPRPGGSDDKIDPLVVALNAHDPMPRLPAREYRSEQPAHPSRAFVGRAQMRAN